ncbi:MAG TPA: BatD family protein [Polyangiaceae bacterium]|jgi:hypothetical protein|nr:BatD family protein [Polyangiaceae bacterium]
MFRYRRTTSIIGVAAALGLLTPAAVAAGPATMTSGSRAMPAMRLRTSLRLDVGRPSAWIGQAIPITVRAQFRDVDGVTLEGTPQLRSEGVFTSDLAREPHQSTMVIDGAPVLVATWTGTITPSTSGPFALSVELPVRVRYHEAAEQPAFDGPPDEDPFGMLNLNIDPSDPSSVQRLFRSFEQSFNRDVTQATGRVHDETTTLKATARPVDIKELPVSGQPPRFTGVVGRFELRAAMTSPDARASEPTTLSVTVRGEGDLDRVEITGLESSRDWKAYPMSVKTKAAEPGKRSAQKTFEQTLIPLHGGALTIPPLSLSEFDPVAGRYTTVSTVPLTVDVTGPAEPVAISPPPAQVSAPPAADSRASSDSTAPRLPPPPSSALVVSTRTLAFRLAPVLLVILGGLAAAFLRRRDDEKSLRRALRVTAKQGSVTAFFDAARRLIVVHFARRWGVPEKEVTADALRRQLGAIADPLVEAMSTADALRFGRRGLPPTELRVVCSSIEASLRNAA